MSLPGEQLEPELPRISLTDVRMDKVVARGHGWCGLDQRADLLCVEGDEVVEQRRGPYVDFDLSEVWDWSYRCALHEGGALECDGAELAVPSGPFERVHVGVYGACARGGGHAACWSTLPLPAVHVPPDFQGTLSVHGGNVCWGQDARFECQGPSGERWLPEAGRYFVAQATRTGACAAIWPPLDPSTLPALDPATDVALRSAQIACFSAQGIESKALGVFVLFDVDSEGQGCAVAHDGAPTCWGRYTSALPQRSQPPYSQISVSDSQVCWLGWDGAVECVGL